MRFQVNQSLPERRLSPVVRYVVACIFLGAVCFAAIAGASETKRRSLQIIDAMKAAGSCAGISDYDSSDVASLRQALGLSYIDSELNARLAKAAASFRDLYPVEWVTLKATNMEIRNLHTYAEQNEVDKAAWATRLASLRNLFIPLVDLSPIPFLVGDALVSVELSAPKNTKGDFNGLIKAKYFASPRALLFKDGLPAQELLAEVEIQKHIYNEIAREFYVEVALDRRVRINDGAGGFPRAAVDLQVREYALEQGLPFFLGFCGGEDQ